MVLFFLLLLRLAYATEMTVTEKFIEISHMTPNSVIEFGFRPKEDGQPVSFVLIVGGMASTTNCSKFSVQVFSLKSGELIDKTCNTAVSIMQFDPNIQGYRFYITGDEVLTGGTIEVQPDKDITYVGTLRATGPIHLSGHLVLNGPLHIIGGLPALGAEDPTLNLTFYLEEIVSGLPASSPCEIYEGNEKCLHHIEANKKMNPGTTFTIARETNIVFDIRIELLSQI